VQDKNYFQLRNLNLAENFKRNKKKEYFKKSEVDFTSVILQAFLLSISNPVPASSPLLLFFGLPFPNFYTFLLVVILIPAFLLVLVKKMVSQDSIDIDDKYWPCYV
jgi:hypothetical protein